MSKEVELERMVVRLLGDAQGLEKTLMSGERMMTRTARKMRSIGQQMSLSVTAPLQIMAAISVKSFSDFDDAMTKSTSIMSGITADVREEMERTALTLSTKTVTSATDAAEAYFFLASAGKDAEQSMALLPKVERFATAGAFDMAQATDLLTDAQSALGLTSKDVAQDTMNLARVSDVLIKANTLANASAEQFSKALITKSGAALRLVNKDVEEGVAILAAYADQGIKAENAGEKLAIMLRDLQTASIKNTAEWEKMGLTVFDAEGKLLPLVDIIRQMEGVLGDATDEQKKLTMMQLGFTDRSVNAITSLVGMSDKIAQYEKDLRSAGGITDEVANKQMKSFASQMKVLRNNMNTVSIEIGKILAPAVLKLNTLIQKGVDWWRSLNDQQKQSIVYGGQIVAMVGPMLVMFGTLLPLLDASAMSLTKMMTVGVRAFTMIRWSALLALLPFIKVIAVIGLVVGAVAGLAYLLVGPEGLAKAWKTVSESFKWFVQKAQGFLFNFRHNMHALFVWFQDNWKTILFDAMKLVKALVVNMGHNFQVGMETLTRLMTVFITWAYDRMKELWEFVFSKEFQVWVAQAAGQLYKWMTTGMKWVLQIFQGLGEGLVMVMKSAAMVTMRIWRNAMQVISDAVAMVLRGEIPDPREMMAKFSARLASEAAHLGNEASEAFNKVTQSLGVDVAKMLDQVENDMSLTRDEGLAGAVGTVLEEQGKKLRSLTDGFEASTLTGPDLKFDLPQKLQEVADTAMDPKEMGITEVAMETATANKHMEDLRKNIETPMRMGGIEGIRGGSLAAMIAAQDHRSRLGLSPGVTAPGETIKSNTIGAPGEADAQRRTTEALEAIQENTDPESTNYLVIERAQLA